MRNDKIKVTMIAVVILVVIDGVLVVVIDVMKEIVDPQVLSRRNEEENKTGKIR